MEETIFFVEKTKNGEGNGGKYLEKEIFEEEKKIQAKNQANIKRQLKDLKKKGFEGKERNWR